MASETRILFWILVVSVLLYLYTDHSIKKLREEMEFHLFVYERVLKDMIIERNKNGTNPITVKGEHTPQAQISMQYDDASQDDFLDQILPSKEDLLEATYRGEKAVEWTPDNAQQVGLQGIDGFAFDGTTSGAGGLGYAEINFG